MQALTAAPRQGEDPALVDALLHADDTRVVDYGADLLDLDDRVLADVSADLRAGTAAPVISWDGTLSIHRKVTLTIARDLRWDRDRLRLWCTLRSDLMRYSARFFGGVFVMVAPTYDTDDTALLAPTADTGAGPGGTQERAAVGYDKLHLLGSPIPDTWTAVSDATQTGVDGQPTVDVGGELRRLLAAAEYRGAVAIDPALGALTIPAAKAQVFDADGTTTWLAALNATLKAVGGAPAWADEVGTLRLGVLVQDAARATEYVADAQSPRTIVGPQRSRQLDLSQVPNAWRFTASGWDLTPTEGDGRYTPDENTGTGPTSVQARGRHVWSLQSVDAVTQDALVAAAEAARAKDMRAAAVRTLTLAPLPILGHQDLLELRDAALSDPVRAVCTRWELHYDGSDGPLTTEEIP